jgi:hypothetical protein
VVANSSKSSSTGSTSGGTFSLSASLELWHEPSAWVRNETRYSYYPRSSTKPGANASTGNFEQCHPRFDTPDHVVGVAAKISADTAASTKLLADAVVWYHRNVKVLNTSTGKLSASYFEDVMREQGLDAAKFSDPLGNLTFGAAMRDALGGMHLVAGDGAAGAPIGGALSGQGLNEVAIEVTAHTAQVQGTAATEFEQPWLAGLLKTMKGASYTPLSTEDTQPASTEVTQPSTQGDKRADSNADVHGFLKQAAKSHEVTWDALWQRSYINASVNAASCMQAGNTHLCTPATTERINQAYTWQRFLDLADGRNSKSMIKFNGQAFTVGHNCTAGGMRGKICSADFRDW